MYWKLAKALNGLHLRYDDTKDVPEGNVATHFMDDENSPFWQDMQRMDEYEKQYYTFLSNIFVEELWFIKLENIMMQPLTRLTA